MRNYILNEIVRVKNESRYTRYSYVALFAVLFVVTAGIVAGFTLFGTLKNDESLLTLTCIGINLPISMLVEFLTFSLCALCVSICAVWIPGIVVNIIMLILKGFILGYSVFATKTLVNADNLIIYMLIGNILPELILLVGFIGASALSLTLWSKRLSEYTHGVRNMPIPRETLRNFIPHAVLMAAGAFLKGVVAPLLLQLVV